MSEPNAKPPNRYFTLEPSPKAWVIIMHLQPALDVQAFNEITELLIDGWPIERGRDVVIDLTNSQFHGSILLGLIINIRSRTHAGGGELIVAGASAGLMQVCRTANLDRLIAMTPTRAQALSRL